MQIFVITILFDTSMKFQGKARMNRWTLCIEAIIFLPLEIHQTPNNCLRKIQFVGCKTLKDGK